MLLVYTRSICCLTTVSYTSRRKSCCFLNKKTPNLPIKSLGKSLFAIKGLQQFSCLKRTGGKMKMNEPDTGVYTVIRKTVTKKGTCAEAGLENVTVGLAAYQLSKWVLRQLCSQVVCSVFFFEWREINEQIDWWKKQPSQVVCIWEDLKCWGVWDTTSRHKAKDITPSITWRREAWKEETLNNLPWKDERGNQTNIGKVNQTNIGTVSRATLGKLLRDRVECMCALLSA